MYHEQKEKNQGQPDCNNQRLSQLQIIHMISYHSNKNLTAFGILVPAYATMHSNIHPSPQNKLQRTQSELDMVFNVAFRQIGHPQFMIYPLRCSNIGQHCVADKDIGLKSMCTLPHRSTWCLKYKSRQDLQLFNAPSLMILKDVSICLLQI